MLLPYLSMEIKEKLIFNTSLTRSPTDLGSQTTPPEMMTTQPTYGLRNTDSMYHKAIRSIFPSSIEESLDEVSQIKDTIDTTCREAPIFDSYPDSDDED